MPWKPNIQTQSVIDQSVQNILDDLAVSLKIDEMIPGCDVVNADTYGTGVLPRYITVGLRGGYQVPVFYRGGITGFGVGTIVTVVHYRDGNRYEVFGVGGSTGSTVAPASDDAEYITYAANADLTNERVLNDGAWNTVDLSVAAQAAINFEPDSPALVTVDGEVTEYATIQLAIDNAVGDDGDVVVIPPGTYDENITLAEGVAVVELFSGTVTIEATGGTVAVTIPAPGGDYYINIHSIKAEQSLNSAAAANGLAAVECNHVYGTAIIYADLSCINTYDAGNANSMGIRNTAAGSIIYRGKDAEWNIYVMSEGDDWGSYAVRNESTGDITGYGTIFAYSPNDGAWAYCIQNRGAAVITWAGNLHLECSTDGDVIHTRGGATVIYNGDIYGYADEHIRGIIARDGACTIYAKGRMTLTTPYSYAIGIENCYAGYTSSSDIVYEGIIDVNTDDGSARGVEVIGGTCTGTITLLDVDVIVAGTGDSYGVDNEIAGATITVIGGRISTTSAGGSPYDLRQTAGTLNSFCTQHDTITGTITWLDGVALESLRDYAQGNLIIGGAVDWEALSIGNIGDVLTVNAGGTEPEWQPGGGGGGNTLDEAYDEGGAGVGRTITADTGAVYIAGTDGLQVDNTADIQELRVYDSTELTIDAAGAITRTQTYHRVDTYSDAASDNLDTINGGATGDVLILRLENAARTVTLRYMAGNIWTLDRDDITLTNPSDHIILVYDGSYWCTVERGEGVTGSGSSGQLAYWDGTSTIAGDAGLTYNAATDTLTIAGDILLSDDHFVGISGDIRIEFDSSDGDIMLRLGDNAGSDEVQIIDSDSTPVFRVDSDGNLVQVGTITSSGDVILSDDHYIGVAGDLRVEFDTSAGDLKLHYGDAAGGDDIRFVDSGGGTVFRVDSDGNVIADSDARIGAGLYVGSLGVAPTNDTIIAVDDIIAGGGLAAGDVSVNPSAGNVRYTGSLRPVRSGIAYTAVSWVYLATAYTNAAFNGNSFSDVTSNTKIENTSWSTTVPAAATAILLRITVRDSGSAADTNLKLAFYTTAGAGSAIHQVYLEGIANDGLIERQVVIPCTDGDIWYQVNASGVNTMDVWLKVLGFAL